MRKFLTAFLLTTTLLLLSSVNLFAQTRINFRRGTSSATVSGTISFNDGIAGPAYRTYVVRANGGQTIRATVSSRNGQVVFPSNEKKTYTVRTGEAGDYEIVIYNGGDADTRYSLTVSIR